MSIPSDAELQDDWALAQAWMPRLADASAPGDAIERLLAGAKARNDPRLAWLSLAWDALARSRFFIGPTELQALERDHERLKATGWLRAQRLAEAALAAALHRSPDRRREAIALLQAHGPAEADPRPAVERLWTDVTLALLLAAMGRHDEALSVALVADRLARQVALPAAEFAAARALGYLFLSTGDIEAALGVMDRELSASRRSGLGRISTRANLALAYLIAGRPTQVLALLDEDPWFLDTARDSADPTPACLIACALARCGRVDEALALLPAQLKPPENDLALRANCAWTSATVYLAAGQATRARSQLKAFLSDPELTRHPLSPMNGTQIHQVLAEACEAVGDLPGALAALKQSQRHCFSWVASSVRMRLQALHGEAAGADRARQERRLRAIEQVADQASSPEQFVAHVAHEMRNPLTGVIGMTSLLMMSDLDERQRKHVELAQTSAQIMMRLCSDLLDLARLDAGKFSLHLEALDLRALLQQAAATFEPLAAAKGLEFIVTLPDSLPREVVTDAIRVQQVVMNLLSNAFKFCRAGRVELRALAHPSDPGRLGRVRVEVRDSGPGLPDGARERLFREFSRFESRPGGTRLGLALCRQLIGRLGGEIDVECPAGGGSVFWFELPVSTVSQAVTA